MLAMAPVAVVTALDAFFGTDKITLILDNRAPGHRGARTYDRLHDVVKDVDRARVLVGFPSATLTSKAPASAARSAATPLIATSNRSAERGVRVAGGGEHGRLPQRHRACVLLGYFPRRRQPYS